MQLIRARSFAAAMAVALAGCASPPGTRGLDQVKSLVDSHDGTRYAWAGALRPRSETDEHVELLLKQPLSADTAVQIALLRNPRMQIEYARLGIADADVLEASRLSNPTLSAAILEPTNGAFASLVTSGLTQSFSDLLLIGVRKRLAEGEYQHAQLVMAGAILDLSTDVRAAWYTAACAQQVATMRANIDRAAQTSAALAGKYHDAGNISVLQLTLEQADATQARLAVTRAHAEARRARAALSELLGLERQQDLWTISDRIPIPVPREDEPEALFELAGLQRLDLLAARSEVSVLELSLQTTRRYRWLGRVDVGVEAERDDDRARLLGPSLALQLPLFNQSQGSIARAQALLDERRGRLRALELAIDTAVRLGAERVQAAREIADEYRSALIPQRNAALQASQENANYMLIGTFELLLTKQQQCDAYQGYLEAIRDYWLARIDLMRTVGARLPSEGTATTHADLPASSNEEPVR